MIRNKIKLIVINIGILLSFFIILEFLSGYLMSQRREKGLQVFNLIYKLKTKLSVIGSVERKIKLLNNLKDNGEEVYTSYLFDPQRHPPGNFYWLTHPSNKKIIYCEEGSGIIKFNTNNLGFRKLGLVSNPNKIETIYLGDSYTEGACVNDSYTIPQAIADINNHSYENILNAGIGGTGPLFQLSVFKEILNYSKTNKLTFAKDKKLVWIIFSGNDLKNLAEEKTTSLSNYFNDTYTQDYFVNLRTINKSQKIFLDQLFKQNKDFIEDSTIIDGHGYGETINNPLAVENELKLFYKLLYMMKKLADENSFELNIVLLSDHPYFKKFIQNPTQELVNKFCSETNIKCLEVKIKDIDGDLPGHFDQKGYLNISKVISNFIYAND